MASGLLASCLRMYGGPRPELDWTWESRSVLEEARPALEFLAAAMTREGYPDPDIFEVRLAAEEALVNAIRHGNGGDPARLVQVRCEVDSDRVLVEVRDQGPGFDPERTDGNGLALMRRCSSWLRYNHAGNRVTLCKYRSQLGPAVR